MGGRKNILDTVKEDFVLGDGGMLSEAGFRGYSTPRITVEFPEVLKQIHADFFRAGAQVLQALTWWSTGSYLDARGKKGWASRAEEVNRTAIRMAKEAADGEAFVAGSLCQAAYPPNQIDLDDPEQRARAQAEWDQQIEIMAAEGVDFLICEAFHRLGEMKLVLECCKKTDLPVVACITGTVYLERTVRWDRVETAPPAECARFMVDHGADIVGMNCGIEPSVMFSLVLEMRDAVDAPIVFMPGGFQRRVPGYRQMHESMITPGAEMAHYALKAREEGIEYIAGCCGAGPEIIRAMAQALGRERYPI